MTTGKYPSQLKVKKMKKHEIVQRTLYQIGFGLLLLLLWYAIEEPKNIVNRNPPNSIDDPGTQLFINFFSWLALIAAIGLLMVGSAGIIRILIKK